MLHTTTWVDISKKYFAFPLIFVSVLVYGAYTGIQKQGLEVVINPTSFAFYTMVYCSLFIFPFAAYELIKGSAKLKYLGKMNILLPLVSISLISQFFALQLKLYALTFTTAGSVGLLASFSSVTLSIYSVLLLKEKLSKNFFLVLIMMCFGLALFKFTPGAGFSFGLGELLVLVFICLVSLSNSIAKLSMNKKVPPYITSFCRAFFATPLLGFIVVLTGNFSIDHLFSFWPIFAGFIFAVRIVTLYSGMNLTRLSNVAVFNVFVPLVTFAYAYLFLGEKLHVIQIIGALIVLVGTYELYLQKKKQMSTIEKFFNLFKKPNIIDNTI